MAMATVEERLYGLEREVREMRNDLAKVCNT